MKSSFKIENKILKEIFKRTCFVFCDRQWLLLLLDDNC